MNARSFLAALLTLSFGGCGASLPSLTTGSLFGGGAKAASSPVVKNDPVTRAMNVASTSARAMKCGYNFDPSKLRNQFLASEAAANPDAGGTLPQVYDTTFGGVSKAIAAQEDAYCTPDKTARIKDALNRNLAGDYTASSQEPTAAPEGLFSGWEGGTGSETPFDNKAPFEN